MSRRDRREDVAIYTALNPISVPRVNFFIFQLGSEVERQKACAAILSSAVTNSFTQAHEHEQTNEHRSMRESESMRRRAREGAGGSGSDGVWAYTALFMLYICNKIKL